MVICSFVKAVEMEKGEYLENDKNSEFILNPYYWLARYFVNNYLYFNLFK